MKTLFVVAMTVLCSCVHKAASSALDKAASTYQVINLGPEFERFWQAAANRPFAEQLQLWNQIVEKPYQPFYDSMVWQKKENPQWDERKTRRLKEMFGKYPALYPRMSDGFRSFDQTLAIEMGKFKKSFPDAHFVLPIYAAPTATFNGKGGENGDADPALGKTVLAFGIDMMVEFNNDPDVLYSHELFHIYHTDAIAMNEHVFLDEGHLTLPLWLEGLATYVSLEMNPKAGLAAVLMDKDLPKVTEAQIRGLARNFLASANEKAFDEKKPEVYKKWFAIDPKYTLGGGLPSRCGYLLGLRVAQSLAETHSLTEMVHWKVDEIHRRVQEALTRISTNPVTGPRK